MKASVIIPTKNPGPLFKELIQAVLTQQSDWPFEVLVIDSGSTDGTVEYLLSRPEVQLHQIPAAEFGHGRTRNLGIAMTSGEFAVLITHDALPANTEWLQALIDVMELSPEIAGTFGRHLAYPHHSPFLHRDLQGHFDGFANADQVVRLDDAERYANDAGYRQFLHFFSDNNACVRRSVWEKIPYPDVDFAEDQIWAEKIIQAGYAKGYADKAMVYHSHDYGVLETLSRSFDESRALKQLFGYQLCPSLAHLLVQTLRCSLRDYRYLVSLRNTQLKYWLKMPFGHLARQIGYMLGNSNLSTSVTCWLSLDKRLHATSKHS